MALLVSGQVGPAVVADGVGSQPFRQEKTGAMVVQEVHGRFYEQCYRGNIYTAGMLLTSISNATFTTATTGVTATPIIGVWNPSSSTVNVVLLQAVLGVTVTAGTATGGGPFAWMACTGNAAISTGITPINRKTLAASGSQAKAFANTALTGMTGTLAVLCGSALSGGLIKNASSVETAVGQNIGTAGVTVENLDGSIIVPPGGVVGLFATTTPVAHSAVSGLVWEEVPL